MDKNGPERASKTRGDDLLRIRKGQKEPYYGQEWIRKSQQDATISGEEWARKSHQDPVVPFIVDKNGPGRVLLWIRMDQTEPPRPGNTICYGYEWVRKSRQYPEVRFATDKNRL